MNVHAVALSTVQLKPLFREVLSKTQAEAEALLCLPTKEKVSRFTDQFFTYLQENLELFNGADPDLNSLIERLEPFKSPQLRIERLLQKIIQDLRSQNRRLTDVSKMPKPLEESVSVSIRQPPLGIPPASLNCGRLAASAPVNRDKHQRTAFPDALYLKILESHFPSLAAGPLLPAEITKIFAEAFELFKQAANLGDSTALVLMGLCYETGRGVPAQDDAKAFECFQQAANLGNSNALAEMGRCYKTGRGVPAQNDAKAFECFQQAANLGNSDALVLMGRCYWTGNGVPANKEKAFEYWLTAKKRNHDLGALNVAKCLTWGQGTNQNRAEAKAILLDLMFRNMDDARTFYAEYF